MLFGHVIAQIAAAAARLGLPDLLAGGPRAAPELAAAVGAEPATFARFLAACASLGLLEEDPPGRFGLNPLGRWLGSAHPSLRDLAIALTDPAHWRCIGRLGDCVLTGRPAPPDALGPDLWAYYREHPEEGRGFAAAMAGLSAGVAEELLAGWDPAPFRVIVDVGGSHGVLLAGILRANPRARGILFDLPEVVAGARPVLESGGVADRVEVVGGDVLEAVPPGGDLYLLKHVLHNWDDRVALRILRNCRRAAGTGTTLLVLERLLGPGADPFAHVADVLMLVMFGGRERSRAEYEDLLAGAGYRLERVVPLSIVRALEARAV